MSGTSDTLQPDTPECHHPQGHAWVSGRAELNDEELVEIVSRQCRRCGYEEEIPDE